MLNAIKPLTSAFKTGMRSLGEEAALKYLAQQGMQANLDDAAKVIINGMNADDAAQAIAKMSRDADDYLASMSQAFPQQSFDSVGEELAYGIGRKTQGIKQKVGNTVQSMGGVPAVAMNAAFMYPMIAQVFQGQPEEYR